MSRFLPVRFALVSLALPTAVTLAACGHSGTHASTASSSSSRPSASATSAKASGGNCAAGFVSGTIAGQAKCLQNGQQCQQENANDYKKYGFACTKTNGRYELQKK